MLFFIKIDEEALKIFLPMMEKEPKKIVKRTAKKWNKKTKRHESCDLYECALYCPVRVGVPLVVCKVVVVGKVV